MLLTMKHTPILVSGSLAYDKIMDYDGRFSDHVIPGKVHTLNVSFVTERLSEHFGGTAGNIAYTLALLGQTPLVLATAGTDFGPYREKLDQAGVDLKFVQISPEKLTASATIMTDASDNQIVAFYVGAMADPWEMDSGELPSDALAIVSAGNFDDMRRFPALYREKRIPFIFDPGQQVGALSADDLKNGMTGAKVVISNDYELSLIIEKTGWSEEDILGHAEMLVTTLGAEGSRIRVGEQILKIPPAVVRDPVDPTGAGDAYRAGFIKGLLEGWPLETVGRFAGAIAACVIELYGSQEHTITFHEAHARYRESFGAELPS